MEIIHDVTVPLMSRESPRHLHLDVVMMIIIAIHPIAQDHQGQGLLLGLEENLDRQPKNPLCQEKVVVLKNIGTSGPRTY